MSADCDNEGETICDRSTDDHTFLHRSDRLKYGRRGAQWVKNRKLCSGSKSWCSVSGTLKDIVDSEDVCEEEAVEFALLDLLREFGPVVGVAVVFGFVFRVLPETRLQ